MEHGLVCHVDYAAEPVLYPEVGRCWWGCVRWGRGYVHLLRGLVFVCARRAEWCSLLGLLFPFVEEREDCVWYMCDVDGSKLVGVGGAPEMGALL